MLISLNWLKNYVDIPSKYSSKEIGDFMTIHSCEVEQVIDQAANFDKIIAAKIVKIEKHPDADKLQLPTLDTGNGEVKLVCGAPNIEVGQIVPLAQEGARAQHDGEYFEIKKAKIRGVESCGMLCSEVELGLSNESSGILILPESTPIGKAFAEIYGMDDVLLEIDNKSLTHRPDLWGHLGMAREFGAVFNTNFRDLSLAEIKTDKDEVKFKVSVEDTDLCPRYMGLAMKNIEVKPSESYIQKRLQAVGLRPINNIVDITNYVMLELGQPVHAFDLARLDSQEILVRRAKKGEKIKLLDEKEYELNTDNLVITNAKKAVALAGVMGGEESSIADNSTEIFLESANFEAANNRQTASSLGIRTDSSMRYEKSLDPALCQKALSRMVELIRQSCPDAYIASEVFDINAWQDPKLKLKIDAETISKKAGVKIADKEVKEILTRLGFEVDAKLNVTVPSWRVSKDILIPIDLVEEVARIHGYENIPAQNPKWPIAHPIQNPSHLLEKSIKQILTKVCDCYEVINYSFVGEDLLKKLDQDDSKHIKLKNPLASDQSMLRKSLLPNLLLAAQRNIRFQDQVRLFETGSVFSKEEGIYSKDSQSKETLPDQKRLLTVLLSADFYEIKRIIETIAAELKLKVKYQPEQKASSKASANILINKQLLGEISTLNDKISKEFDLTDASYLVLDLEKLSTLLPETPQYQELAKFPAVKRDYAVLFDENVEIGPVITKLQQLDKLIVDSSLFDVYRGKGVPKGKKSIALNVVLQDPEKTLTEAEITKAQDKVLTEIKKLGGEIRG